MKLLKCKKKNFKKYFSNKSIYFKKDYLLLTYIGDG